MGKLQGPVNHVMYYRLDRVDAAKLQAIAREAELPVADISRRAVRQFLQGGADRWAEVENAKLEASSDPLVNALRAALHEDHPLTDAVLSLAAWSRERTEVRTALLSLARLRTPDERAPRRRAKRTAS